MITANINRSLMLPCNIKDIKQFTINQSDFFFLECDGCRMIKCSSCMQVIDVIELGRKYLCLCYDSNEECYWAVPECKPHLIYRLDLCFHKTGEILVSGVGQQCAINLCCDPCEDGIWVCYTSQIAFVKKCSQKVKWCINEDKTQKNISFLSLCKCRMLHYYEQSREIVEVILPFGEETIELCVPKKYRLVAMAPCPCKEGCNQCCICVVFLDLCSGELVLNEYCICFSKTPKDNCCDNFCCNMHPYTECRSGSYEVLHSIALEEAGISHILNAEGEKIQKAVAISDNVEHLICVNESVKHTLTQITLLEGMLYSKLETLVNSCVFCDETKDPCSVCCNDYK